MIQAINLAHSEAMHQGHQNLAPQMWETLP
jgi:hypothetical protein